MKYDHNQAIEKATELFWQKGFQGTKMRDLQNHLDMRPGSIYAGFGSKENLFLLALDCYVTQTIFTLDNYNQSTENPLEALKFFISGYLFVNGELASCRTCLLVKTVSESETSHPKFHQHALLGLQKVEQAFTQLFSQAQTLGHLDRKADCQHLGKWLQMQIMGLVMYAKNNAAAEDITAMIEHVFATLQTPAH